jgi:hypothetical protein
MMELLQLFLAFVVGVISSARLTRLITQDSFPPAAWVRAKWDDRTDGSSWNDLFHCHWCMSFWTTLPIGLWGWLSNFHVSWWVVNILLAGSYLNAMLVERDEKD